MKCYISSSVEDQDVVKELARKLERDGHTITFKWWNVAPNINQEKVAHCEQSIKGVQDCDTFIFYNGVHKTSGKYVELGIALSEYKYMVGMGRRITGIFNVMFDEWIDEDDDCDILYEIFTRRCVQ